MRKESIVEIFSELLKICADNAQVLGGLIGFALFVSEERKKTWVGTAGRIFAVTGIILVLFLIPKSGPIFAYNGIPSQVFIAGFMTYVIIKYWLGDMIFPKLEDDKNKNDSE